MTVKQSRPTSPHLQIYQLPLTAIVSISHRITGVFLTLGMLLVVVILFVLSQGENTYSAMQTVNHFWFVKLVYWGFIFALFFHLCHGVRHLWWDIGEGFDVSKLNKLAIIELAAAFGLTFVTWIIS